MDPYLRHGLVECGLPLGMYSLTTLTFGQLAPLPFMELIARGVFWVAVAAWLFVVGALMVRVAPRRGPKATVD